MSEADFTLDGWQIRLVLPHRPPFLQLDRIDRCAVTLDALEASKVIGGCDPMLQYVASEVAFLAPAALIEGLAQCCGLLVRLRWLAAAGVDLAAFAAGDRSQLDRNEIPRSALVESEARFSARPGPGSLLRLTVRRELSHGEIHRFAASASRITAQGAAEAVTGRIMLKFPYRA